MNKSNLTALQRIERANIELLGHPATVAYAGVIMVGDYKIVPDLPTARTDGVNCEYGERFILGLTEPEVRAIIMHETLHKTFQHLFLWRNLFEKDARCANMALDFVINLTIKDIDTATKGYVSLPKGGCLDEKYRGMDSQQVFNILLDDKANGGGGGQGKDGQGSMDEHDWGKAKALSKKEVEAVAREIDQAIRQGQMLAGKMGGDESRVLGELTTPTENWREQVSEFMTSTTANGDISTYRKVNRRWLQHDIYMPSTISESMGSLVIAVDLSGSVGQEELNEFMSHVVLMCNTLKPERVDLMYWDTSVTVHEVYGQDDLERIISSTRPVGGGGTQVECVADYIKANKMNPDCIIVLTDGYVGGSWGEWSHPLLWGIVGGNTSTPNVGKVVHIK